MQVFGETVIAALICLLFAFISYVVTGSQQVAAITYGVSSVLGAYMILEPALGEWYVRHGNRKKA